MHRSSKAALLSAFVFPGAGHLYLKKAVPAAVLAIIAFAALYLLIASAMQRALQISASIQRGDVPLDIAAIAQLASQQAVGSDTQVLRMATTALLLAWLIGIIDAFRVGRAQDKHDAAEH
jgi:hypothetical protein